MNINNLYEIYFSPTGGTKETVEVFSAQWSIAKSVIDLSDMNVEFDKYEFYNDDLCIIAVPSFGGRAPAVAIQRIKELKGNNTPAVIITTYGNRAYGDTLIELQQVVEEVGFCVVAALSVVTQHSIIPQYGFARPDALDKTRLAEMAIKIKVHIERAVGFNVAKLGEKKLLREYKGSNLKPANVGKCIKCGICAKNCPVGAIPLDNPKATETEKCISCMRCVNKCPKSSRKISEVKVSALANKIKKECIERKEIEIFVNKNLNKDIDEVYESVENEEQEIQINNNASIDEIEEISVSHIAIEDAKQDVNLDGVLVTRQTEEQPMYEEPIYEEPVQPMYEEPIYEEPVQPMYEESIYEEPVQPVYEEPTYEELAQPVYEEPIYEESDQPVYEELTYEEPVYEELTHEEVYEKNRVLPNTFADMQKLFRKSESDDLQIEKEGQKEELERQQEMQRQQEELERQQEIQRQQEELERQREMQRQKEELERQQEIQRQKEELERQQEMQRQQEELERQQEIQRQKEELERQREMQRQKEELERQREIQRQQEELEKYQEENLQQQMGEEVEQDILNAEQLEDIPDDFVLPEPEEITMPENMKGVSLDEIENDPYELDEDLLDDGEIDEIMELDEIVEQERPEVEHPKDFVLNIDAELEDIKEDVEEIVEEIEDEIGIILEDA